MSDGSASLDKSVSLSVSLNQLLFNVSTLLAIDRNELWALSADRLFANPVACVLSVIVRAELSRLQVQARACQSARKLSVAWWHISARSDCKSLLLL